MIRVSRVSRVSRVTFLTLFGSLIIQSATAATDLTVMSWNVENFFNTTHDPGKNDVEFTPEGSAKWTESVYREKTSRLAELIRKSTSDRKGPDILFLMEIENRQVLEALRTKLAAGYRIIHVESEDPRGIDCAVFSKVPGVLVAAHRVPAPPGIGPDGRPLPATTQPASTTQPANFMGEDGIIYLTTRRILEVDFKINGHTLKAFVNHWPSRMLGQEESAPRRISAAKIVSGAVTAALLKDPKADIIIAGDLNDEAEDESIRLVLRAIGDEPKVAAQLGEAFDAAKPVNLYNLQAEIVDLEKIYRTKVQYPADYRQKVASLLQARGTFYFSRDKSWDALDHMIVSPGMLDREGIRVKNNTFHVVRYADHTDEKGAPIPYHLGTDGQYNDGFSDHFPVMTTLTVY